MVVVVGGWCDVAVRLRAQLDLLPLRGGINFVSADGRCDILRPPGIAGNAPIRDAGYVGGLWWSPYPSPSWLLNETTLQSEIVTANASAVGVPAGLEGSDHVLVSGSVSYNVVVLDGEPPLPDEDEDDLTLTALPVTSGSPPVVGWAAEGTESIVIELWEDAAELTHETAVLTVPNTLLDGTGYGGATYSTTVSARRITLEDGVVGPISTVQVSDPSTEQP